MNVQQSAVGPAAGWYPGSVPDLSIPAHPAALQAGGVEFLTRAFHSSGALPLNNRVVAITEFEVCGGGSTGRKLKLGVAYEHPDPRLHKALFVKFSRDFDDPIRDLGKTQMASEVRLARLSCAPSFPIAVPRCYFADFDAETGTGVLITERIPYGCEGIEPHYEKCRDHVLPDPLAHYEALLSALARLAGADQAGRLPPSVARDFPFDPAQLTVGHRAPYSAQQFENRVARYAEFARSYPRLFPDRLRSIDFIARLRIEIRRMPEAEGRIRKHLQQQLDSIALCHWNANIDNAWFWRNAQGQLECGLMDWGCASRMHVAMAIWGALSAADLTLWERHLDRLLSRFIAVFHEAGGAALAPLQLKQDLMRYVAIMGATWLLDAPAYLSKLVPNLDESATPLHPRIQNLEAARVQLQMLTNFLHLWDAENIGQLLD